MIRLIEGDTFDGMNTLPDKSIDLILCDLPYGSTKNKWDVQLSFYMLWHHYSRLIKPNGVIVLFGQGMFTAQLIMSNPTYYRYNIIWEKTTVTGHLNAKKQPLRCHEDIIVFAPSSSHCYNPQKTTGHPRKVSTAAHKRNSKATTNYSAHGKTSYDSTERFPRSVWKFKTDKQKSSLHPTQKPVALLEEIIKTYSHEGAVILDNCAGSGSTGEAADNLNRDCILIDNDPSCIATIKNRLKIS